MAGQRKTRLRPELPYEQSLAGILRMRDHAVCGVFLDKPAALPHHDMIVKELVIHTDLPDLKAVYDPHINYAREREDAHIQSRDVESRYLDEIMQRLDCSEHCIADIKTIEDEHQDYSGAYACPDLMQD